MSSANQPLAAGVATSGDGGDALLSHNFLLGERLYFFSRLRFLAAAGILTGTLFAIQVVGIEGLNLHALAGTAVFLATLYLGWWSTFAYLAAIAPIICWHLDDWLGLPRVVLPLDIPGRASAFVDARWPA